MTRLPPSAQQIDCPSCGRPNPPGFSFCGNCGAALQRTCPSCGSTNPASFRFCGSCGTALLDVIPAEAPALEERKVVTVLFADLTASTELAARMDPEDLRGLLQPFFAAMAEEVERFEGTIEKFIGDAVVAVFGAPTAHEDDPLRAVRAAIAMHRRLADLNAERTDAPLLAMRIGVNTGEVMAAVGSERQGIVTGEAVNVAARLQAAAPSGSVLVSERTFRDTRLLFEYRPVGEITVKGIDRPLRAWELVREVPVVEAPGITPGRLVGRTSELDLLWILLRRSEREGTPHLVTLVGPAGIGKTRLTQEFVERVRAENPAVRIVRGRCLPYGEGLTYWPLAEILKDDSGILDSDPAEAIVDRAAAAIRGRLGEEAAEVTGVLLSSIGVEVEADPLTGSPPEVARRLIARAWRLYLESLASGTPAVAVIEDLHWADPGLLDVLEHLAERTLAPLLFLCTARPELSERRPGWGGGTRNLTTLALPPLSGAESEDLIRGLLGGGHIPEDALRAVLDRAEGTPFFAEELVRMLTEDGVLVRRGSAWISEGGMPETLPDTVQAAIAARIDRLPLEEKRALQDAAVVGRTFWEGAVERLGATGAALDAVVAKGLLVEHKASTIGGDRELAFNHVLTRDVAYQSIPRRRRAEAHAQAGAWVEELTRGRWEEFAEILAHHFEQAGDGDRTARYALLAGHRKLRVFAAEEAIRWYERAIEAAHEVPEARRLSAEATLARGDALEQLARFTEAEEAYRRGLRMARELGDGGLEARGLAALVHVLWLEDRFDDGRRALPEALGKARALGANDLLARLLYTAGTMAFGRGEWEESVRYHQEAVRVARASGDPEGEAFAEHGLCETYDLWGYFPEGLEHGLRSSHLLREAGNRPMLYHNEYMVGLSLWGVGRLADSLRSSNGALEGAHDLGDRRNEAAARQARALTRLSMGELGGALADADHAVDIQRTVPSPRQKLTGLVFRMEVLAELESMDRLAEDVPKARALSDAIGGRYLRPRLAAYEAWLALRRGERRAARELFDRARRESDEVPLEALVSGRLELLAHLEVGDAGAARAAADLLTNLTQDRSPRFLAWGLWGRARAEALAQGWEEALRSADAAWNVARGVDAPAAWRAAALASRAVGALGRTAEPATWRELAAAILRRMAETLDEPARGQFLRRPDVAEILGG